ncbi:hypothetical protein [Emticicia sp. SJ17W-69]|uniref:hypothetical protein n=1 Tax=Emticicia sp. SJ17W-69 TaxID=3421657 RepID=UPI003EB80F03
MKNYILNLSNVEILNRQQLKQITGGLGDDFASCSPTCPPGKTAPTCECSGNCSSEDASTNSVGKCWCGTPSPDPATTKNCPS